MTISPGFYKQGEENIVCNLKKSLYGLKWSSRAWFDKFAKLRKS